MLVWILKKCNLPQNRIRKLVEKLTRVKTVASAIFYTLMVFIVVFGISGDVYAGFPRFVPYVIIAVFLFMAFIRMYQCMVDDSYIREVAGKKIDDSEKKQREKSEKTANRKTKLISAPKNGQKSIPEGEKETEALPGGQSETPSEQPSGDEIPEYAVGSAGDADEMLNKVLPLPDAPDHTQK